MATARLEVRAAETLSPVGLPDVKLGGMPDPLDTLEGKTITFWHDSTPEADVIFPVISRYLHEKGVGEVLLAKQPGPARPPLEENLDLVRRSHAVLAGVAW